MEVGFPGLSLNSMPTSSLNFITSIKRRFHLIMGACGLASSAPALDLCPYVAAREERRDGARMKVPHRGIVMVCLSSRPLA